MAFLKVFLDIILHIDKYLYAIIQTYDVWTYGLLFLVIFLETGLVVMPFLPGDSLLFVAGAFAATDALKVEWVFLVILIAAIIGDTVNYHIGKFIGPKVFVKEQSWLFHKEHLARAQRFYEKHGGKTIILARFIPVIRTFAPFVAGIGRMQYLRFLGYNVLGALLWCILFILGGYYFGNISFVKENFGIVIIVIIAISLIPVIKEIVAHRRMKRERK